MFRWTVLSGLALVALVTACGAPTPLSASSLRAAESTTLDQSASQGRFTGLQIVSIEALPVRCPCFELKAEATNKKGLTSVVIQFERLGDKDIKIQNTEIDGRPLRAGERVQLARALAVAGKKATDDAPTIRSVAEDLILQELE